MNKVDIQNISSQILLNNNIKKRNISITSNKNFDDILKHVGQANDELKFTKHVKERMSARNITLSTEELEKMKSAIDKAEEKGVREALVLMDDKAFIASIKSKTIVTTMSAKQLKNNIFTNIDGAIII